ncbi:MAG: glycine cleavage system aminomethyltransferase GcvT [Pirellulales bacterium]
MNIAPQKTPLHDWHAAHGGRMVDFAGWMMPVQYGSIVAEHHATRKAAGLFDVSHMGRIRFDGPGAATYLDGILTRNVAKLSPGQVRYSLITNEAGGILDDVLISRLADAAGGTYYMLVVNASNRPKILDWLKSHPPEAAQGPVEISDLTNLWAMIAVQGPLALGLLEPFAYAELASMKYYSAVETRIAGHGGIVSRTGYTGEDGFELIVGSAVADSIWSSLLEKGAADGVLAAGLGCRDTLRLESAMPLYGHELSEAIDPFAAGLGFAVDLKKGPFPGRDQLQKFSELPNLPRRVGLVLNGKRIAREGAEVLANGQKIGHVTSGTFSPTLEKSIAMGYLPAELGIPGTPVEIDIRGKTEGATVVELPFYKRK